MAASPDEQLAREIAREASYLSERWRLWLFEQLRQDFEAADLERHQVDRLNQRMSEAVNAVERAAKHLKLKGQKARLALTIKEFDATPERVRQGWTGRQVADAVRGRWQLAKAVAFTNERLPVMAERHWLRDKKLTRKRREAKFTLTSIQKWLATEPESKSMASYERWAIAQNKKLRAGKKRFPQRTTIWKRWRMPWPEIVQAVEENRVPGEAESIEKKTGGEAKATRPSSPEAASIPEWDSRLLSRRLHEAREQQGLSLRGIGEQVGLDESTIGHIENHRIQNPTFGTIVKLAAYLGLSLDGLIAAPDSTEDTQRP